MSKKDGQICNKCFQRPVYCECDLESLRQQNSNLQSKVAQLTQERDELFLFQQNIRLQSDPRHSLAAQAQKLTQERNSCSTKLDATVVMLQKKGVQAQKYKEALEKIVENRACTDNLLSNVEIAQEALSVESKEKVNLPGFQLDDKYPDLSKCPNCGGLADNGHDRCDPPNVYSCTKCTKSEED